MSLKKTMVIRGNVEVQDSYIKINKIELFGKSHVSIYISIYKDDTEKKQGEAVDRVVLQVRGKEFTKYFSETELKKLGKSVLAQAYNYAKTTSLFAGATDL
jgi:hypothetical protein